MTPGPGIFRTQLPKGFLASGINCGVRRYRPDLGIIISEIPAVGVAVYTKNNCQAAPLRYCHSILPSNNIRAVITNSGQANAATGKQGEIDNLSMVNAVAKNLDCQSNQVLTASTGVIGEALEIDKITQAVPELINTASDIAEKFATAILTTDLVPKTVSKTLKLSQGDITITGICKGSGMIHPNMATMLGYILVDAKLGTEQAQTLLSHATDLSFNMVSVDGETSTNDTVFLLANGASGVTVEHAADFELLQSAINEVSIILAKSIARDGEGASKLITVNIKNAENNESARRIARSLTISPLLKTAIYGASPNWGRIVARLGQENVSLENIEKCLITFQDCLVFADGKQQLTNKEALKKGMKSDTINLDIDLKNGNCHATAWGCDLSERYVKINAEYVT